MTTTLDLLRDEYAICRLPPESAVPAWANKGVLNAVVRTPDELSIVCLASGVPTRVKRQAEYRVLRVAGPLDLSLTGVLLGIAAPLAASTVSIFAVSSYDTDYVLVRAAQLEAARRALTGAGMTVRQAYRLLNAKGVEIDSVAKGALGGHRKTKVYGRLDCPGAARAIARGGYVAHRVFFADEATAKAAGYRPCHSCMPAGYARWKRRVAAEGSRLVRTRKP